MHRRPISMRRRVAWLMLALLVIVLGACLILGLVLRQRLLVARDATLQLQTALQTKKPASVCQKLSSAADAWQHVAQVSRPLQTVTQHLGSVPTIGRDLVAVPMLIDVASDLTVAGQTGCQILLPMWSDSPWQERLRLAAIELSTHPDDIAELVNRLQRANDALDRTLPLIDRSAALVQYGDELRQIHQYLPQVTAGAQSLQQLGPDLPWLLGLDAPRSYLVALQNPFELRPTGGFIGLVCVLQLDQARPSLQHCQSSEAFDVAAPPDRAMPKPYQRYLRLGGWYLRDANWSPDFPTSAQTLEWFWQLNQQPASDGVIGIDLYALPILVDALGISWRTDGQVSQADQAINDFLDRYYSGPEYRDKTGVGNMLPSVVDRAASLDATKLQKAAIALPTLVAQRHLMVSVDRKPIAVWLAAHGWDGGFQHTILHTLRIVEADVGYGGVNAFIERLTHYDLAFDVEGSPITATLTMTFTNMYSPWAEFTTAHAVFGNCTDPKTLQLERQPGCYAPYIRVYAPEGSHLLAQQGLEESYSPDQRYQRTVFGGYLRIRPGEQRVVQFHYRLPPAMGRQFLFEKQPGTSNLPLLVSTHSANSYAAIWSDATTDREFDLVWQPSGLSVQGQEVPATSALFGSAEAFMRGRQVWQDGDAATALATWQSGKALQRALTFARYLATQGQSTEALRLYALLASASSDGEALYEQAVLLEAAGETVGVDDLYRRAAEHSPANPLAVFQWQRRQLFMGDELESLEPGQWSASAVRHWRELTDTVQRVDSPDVAIAYIQVLSQLAPDDGSLQLNIAALLSRLGRKDEAIQQYMALSTHDDLWGRMASAHIEQIRGNVDAAREQYYRALVLADTYRIAYDISDGLRELGDETGARYAEDWAANMLPKGIDTLMAEAGRLETSDPLRAHQWYARMQRIDPTNALPDYARGKLYLKQGMLEEAQSWLANAVTKAPDVAVYADLLKQVTAMLAAQSSGSHP